MLPVIVLEKKKGVVVIKVSPFCFEKHPKSGCKGGRKHVETM